MGVNRHNRRVSGGQVAAIKLLEYEILNLEFIDGGVVPNASAHLFRDFVDDLAHVFGGIQMAFQLLVAPHGFEDLNEIRGGNDLDTKTPDQFDCSSINTRDVRDRV